MKHVEKGYSYQCTAQKRRMHFSAAIENVIVLTLLSHSYTNTKTRRLNRTEVIVVFYLSTIKSILLV